jgi:pimeloyl-ACP methyl ester carboxylesterase
VKVGDSEIEIQRWPGSAPTILYLHEGLGSAKQWRDFPARVGFDAIAYSRLGYGGSGPISLPRPLDYMQREARSFLPLVLDAMELERPILFGHSDGGSIALLAAAAYPERVAALVLEAPHVFVEAISVDSIAKAKVAYDTSDLRAKLVKHHSANVDLAFRGWNDAWLHPEFRKWNIEDCLASVRVPVLVLQGEEDPYGTRAQVDAIARQVSGPVPALRDEMRRHRDQPDAVIEKTRRFLRETGLFSASS